jgi:HPt (histidine-containing phosphotransfer) domain-containing protein
MANQLTSAGFIFHHQIDAVQLSEMYGNDYPYIEIIFKTVLDNYDEDTNDVLSFYQLGDVEKLRKAVHKMKPVFGFVGMSPVQEKCQELETKCQQAKSIAELSGEVVELMDIFKQARMIIATDHQKLVEYNSAV